LSVNIESLSTGSTPIYLLKVKLEFLVLVLIYLSRYLDQETAKWPLRSSSQTATCYYQS